MISILDFIINYYFIGVILSCIVSLILLFTVFLEDFKESKIKFGLSFIIFSALFSWISLIIFLWMNIDYMHEMYMDYRYKKIFKNDR